MLRLSVPIKVSVAVLGVVALLAIIAMRQAKNQTIPSAAIEGAKAAPQLAETPSCNGASSVLSASYASQVNSHPHSVTLSWNATVPTSNSPREAIKGYYVYRSRTSHSYAEKNRMNESPLPGTRCVDTNVEPRKIYFYVVKAVTAAGTQSGSSIEIKAVVPFP